MVRLLLFLKRIAPLLLFVAIELVALSIFFSHNAYQRAKMVAVSNYFTGGIHGYLSSAKNYFSLKEQNELLLIENAKMRAEIERVSSILGDSLNVEMEIPLQSNFVDCKVVRVVNNTYSRRNNYITISGGTRQGVVPEMALFNSAGIVGYVKYCSEDYSVAISMLNHQDFRTSGKVKGEGNPGSINWDGLDYRRVTMDEIPAHTNIAVGDTIVTTEFSNIFPPNIPIGIVESVDNTTSVLIKAEITTLADMTKLNYLYAVSLKGQNQRTELENRVNN